MLVGMIPINSFLWVATFNDRPNPSTMSMNKKWERGYPCLISIEEWKLGDGETFTKMEKKEEEVKSMFQFTHFLANPKESKVFLM